MQRLQILFLSLAFSASVTSQEVFQSPEFNKFWNNLEHIKRLEGESPISYKGSPYLYETADASITFENGQVIQPLTIRYNVHDDVMEIKKGEVFYTIPKEKYFPLITMGDHSFSLEIYQLLNNKKLGYFEVLVSDSVCSLFLKHRVVFQQAEEAKPYVDAKPAQFKKQVPELYLSHNNGVLQEVKSKKDFIELVNAHHQEIETFIKKNKTKFRNPDSVKELVAYYNSL